MIYRILKGETNSLDTATQDDRFPKVIISEVGRIAVSDEGEFLSATSEMEPTTTVIEPLYTPFVALGVEEYELLFGRDFDTAIFMVGKGNFVVKSEISAPVLTGSINISGNAELVWDKSFETKSKVYRTELYLTGDLYSEFILIAEIDGASIPGDQSSYTDDTIVISNNYSVSYLVSNQNGSSNTLTLDGTP